MRKSPAVSFKVTTESRIRMSYPEGPESTEQKRNFLFFVFQLDSFKVKHFGVIV
jgi:hypothetical protein